MKTVVLSLYDSKVKAFTSPFFAPSEEAGVRSLLDEASVAREGLGAMVQRHPEDFTVFRLGIFDDLDGALVPESAPVSLGLVSGLMNKE